MKYTYKIINFFLINKKERGSLTVEYAACMIFAAVIMAGIVLMYNALTTDIVEQFKTWVINFPDN